MYKERKRWMWDEDKTAEESKLEKEEIKDLAENNDLKVNEEEVDRLYES